MIKSQGHISLHKDEDEYCYVKDSNSVLISIKDGNGNQVGNTSYTGWSLVERKY